MKMRTTNKKISNILEIWDVQDFSIKNKNKILLWNGYEEETNVYSILSYIEKNKIYLKNKYIKMVSDIAYSEINSKKIIEYLRFKGGFDYWWMTLLVEKSIWKSPSLVDAIKLIAVEEFIKKKSITEIIYYSSNTDGKKKVIEDLCNDLKINYKAVSISGLHKLNWSAKLKLFNWKIPHLFQASYVLTRYIVQRWRIKKFAIEKIPKESKTTIFSYLIHLDNAKLKNGQIYSNQWGVLPDILNERGVAINWVNQYLPNRQINTSNDAINLLKNANSTDKINTHFLLDQYLSVPMIFRVIKKFIKLFLISLETGAVRNNFRPRGSLVNLWPILKNDWYSSLMGKSAIYNLLSMELYDAVLGKLPKQKYGFYLQENQAWERALIYYWKKYGHGVISGVPHSSRSFWDLRFSNHGASNFGLGNITIYRPNYTIINGPVAKNIFLDEDYELERLVECETLRYNYLLDVIKGDTYNTFTSKLKVGIFGDFAEDINDRLVKQIVYLSKITLNRYDFIFKPHPSRDIVTGPYVIDYSDLHKILSNISIAIVSSRTSAGLEAFLYGVPVIVLLDDNELNLSPLKDMKHVNFAKNYIEIDEFLNALAAKKELIPEKNVIFYFDKNYGRWNKFLDNLYD